MTSIFMLRLSKVMPASARWLVFLALMAAGLYGPVLGHDLSKVVDMLVVAGWGVLVAWSMALFLGSAPRRLQAAGALLLAVTLLGLLLPGHLVAGIKDLLAPWLGSRPPAEIAGLGADKLVHFMLFCGLAAVLAAARPAFSTLRITAELAVLAFATELLQSYIPGRSASSGDLVADLAGAWLGAMLTRHALGVMAHLPTRLARRA